MKRHITTYQIADSYGYLVRSRFDVQELAHANDNGEHKATDENEVHTRYIAQR